MSSASVHAAYTDEDGPGVVEVTYFGSGDVLTIDDGRGQRMAVGYEAARALVGALRDLSKQRGELDV